MVDRIAPGRLSDFFKRRFLLLVLVCHVVLSLLRYPGPQSGGFYFWAGENGAIASSLVQGKGFANPFPQTETGPSAWVAPLFPYALAAIFLAAGTMTAAAACLSILFQVLIYAGTLWLLYRLVHQTFSPTCARLAAMMWLINPDRVGLTTKVVSEVCLSTFTLLLALLAVVHFGNTPTRRTASLAGLAIGLAVLCLPVMILALPFYLYALSALAQGRLRPRWVAPTVGLALCVAVLAPWTARNYLVFGELIFIKSNFGQKLYVGNNEHLASGESYPYTSPQERQLMVQMGEIPYSRYSFDRAINWIRDHKREYLLRCVRRAFAFWGANAAPTLNRWVQNLYQVLLLGTAVIGLWRHKGRGPVPMLCLAIIVVVPWVYYLTEVYDHPDTGSPSKPS